MRQLDDDLPCCHDLTWFAQRPNNHPIGIS
jgi:hypothetical protein